MRWRDSKQWVALAKWFPPQSTMVALLNTGSVTFSSAVSLTYWFPPKSPHPLPRPLSFKHAWWNNRELDENQLYSILMIALKNRIVFFIAICYSKVYVLEVDYTNKWKNLFMYFFQGQFLRPFVYLSTPLFSHIVILSGAWIKIWEKEKTHVSINILRQVWLNHIQYRWKPHYGGV